LPYPTDPNKNILANAVNFTSRLKPEGSTNIFAALSIALSVCQNGKDFSDASLIIFLTDGEPTSGVIDHKIILDTTKRLNKNLKVPIFSLALGEQADPKFLTQLSFQNHAFSRQLQESLPIDTQITDFFKEINKPLIRNLDFHFAPRNHENDVNFPDASSHTENQELFTIKPTNNLFFKGSELKIVGKFSHKVHHRDSRKSSETCDFTSLTIMGVNKDKDLQFNSCGDSKQMVHKSDYYFLQRLVSYMNVQKLIHEYDNSFLPDSVNCLENTNDEFVHGCELKKKLILVSLEVVRIFYFTFSNKLTIRTKHLK